MATNQHNQHAYDATVCGRAAIYMSGLLAKVWHSGFAALPITPPLRLATAAARPPSSMGLRQAAHPGCRPLQYGLCRRSAPLTALRLHPPAASPCSSMSRACRGSAQHKSTNRFNSTDDHLHHQSTAEKSGPTHHANSELQGIPHVVNPMLIYRPTCGAMPGVAPSSSTRPRVPQAPLNPTAHIKRLQKQTRAGGGCSHGRSCAAGQRCRTSPIAASWPRRRSRRGPSACPCGCCSRRESTRQHISRGRNAQAAGVGAVPSSSFLCHTSADVSFCHESSAR